MHVTQETAFGTILYLEDAANAAGPGFHPGVASGVATGIATGAQPGSFTSMQPGSASGFAVVHDSDVHDDDAQDGLAVQEAEESLFDLEELEDPDAVADVQAELDQAEEGVDLPLDDGPYSKAEYKRMKKLLKKRVNPSRFKHSVNVAKTARIMAKAYGVDPDMARMAGLLHDWDKCLNVEELHDRVDRFGIDVSDEMLTDMPWLLHGPTGAAALEHEQPQFDQAVYQAIARHTLGARNMSKLDMIIFVADKIEPGHPVPAYQALYNRIGRMELFDLFFAVQRENLSYLIDAGRPLNPEAVAVWNHCVKLRS